MSPFVICLLNSLKNNLSTIRTELPLIVGSIDLPDVDLMERTLESNKQKAAIAGIIISPSKNLVTLLILNQIINKKINQDRNNAKDQQNDQQRQGRVKEDKTILLKELAVNSLKIYYIGCILYIFAQVQKSSNMNRPLALVCYICGREFGTKSLGIHIKACEKKWENQESLKPPKQRRPCPRAPPGLQELLSKPNITRNDIQAFNNGSFNTFKEQALMECQYCGRKFNPKSLVPHQKACKTNPMVRKPYVGKGQQKVEQEQPVSRVPGKGYNIPSDPGSNQDINLTPCSRCGRKFAPDRVGKHEKVCKGPETKNVPTISQKYEIKETKKPVLGKKNQTAVPKWKAQSQQLQQAMKQMRKLKAYQEKGGNLADLPPPTRGNYDHYIQCKYCGRKYAKEVAQRHIPKCANIINKPGGIKPSKIQQKYVGNTGAPSFKAQEKPMGMGMGTGGINSTGPKIQINKSGQIPSSQMNQPSPVKLASKPQMLSKNVKR